MSVCIQSTDNLREERDGKCTTKTLQMHFGSPKNQSNFCTIIYSWNLFVTHIRSFPFICFVLPGTMSRYPSGPDTAPVCRHPETWCWMISVWITCWIPSSELFVIYIQLAPCQVHFVFFPILCFFLLSVIGILCLLLFMMFFTQVLDKKWSSHISTCF